MSAEETWLADLAKSKGWQTPSDWTACAGLGDESRVQNLLLFETDTSRELAKRAYP